MKIIGYELSFPKETWIKLITNKKEWGIDYPISSFVNDVYSNAKEMNLNANVLMAMSIEEKGWSMRTGYVPVSARNPGNLGATGKENEYCKFDTWSQGIRAMAQHLAIYVYPLPKLTEILKDPVEDPRIEIMTYGYAGLITNVEDFVGRKDGKITWSAASDYGSNILKIIGMAEKLLPQSTTTTTTKKEVVMKTVLLDAGHEKEDRGFYGAGYERKEGVNNFLTVELIEKYLVENYANVKVLKVRNKIEDNPWNPRITQKADLMLSFHSNAYAEGKGSVRGTEVYYQQYTDGGNFAPKLSQAVAAVFGHRNRGRKIGNLAVLRESRQLGIKTAVLLEAGFHDNPEDARILIEKRGEIAKTVAIQIANYLKLEKKTASTKAPSAPTVKSKPAPVSSTGTGDRVNGPYTNEKGEVLIFRAIASSELTKAPAQKIVDTLKKEGYDAWLDSAFVKLK